MKEIKIKVWHLFFAAIVIPFIFSLLMGHFVVNPMAKKEAQKKFDSLVDDMTPELDSLYKQGFEFGKVSMAYGMIKQFDSMGYLPKRSDSNILSLRRASQIADSIRIKYEK